MYCFLEMFYNLLLDSRVAQHDFRFRNLFFKNFLDAEHAG